jgi:hypothetical protein
VLRPIASTLLLALLAGSAAAQGTERTGVVFLDRNANGARDAGEPGVAGVLVSDQRDVTVTDSAGRFRVPGTASGIVFVTVPNGHRSVGPFWRNTKTDAGAIAFALAPAPRVTSFTFVHASDTHISDASRPRMQRFRALADSLKPAFAIVTGDLVKDALRVSEAEARGYYDLFAAEAKQFTVPLWTVPGNHENFGIERDKSHVSADHPLFGRAMYHAYRGPDYYSFDYGGVHFIGLNSVDIDDQWYYGHVDATQLAWLANDLAHVPAATPVVTFNHIPFFGTADQWNGYTADPPAPTLITVGGTTAFRHNVSNAADVLAAMKGHRFEMALGGHYHMRESITYEIEGVPTRFQQAAAVVAPTKTGGVTHRSGITLYRVTNGHLDDGTFVPLP